jgi:hypothetical protein
MNFPDFSSIGIYFFAWKMIFQFCFKVWKIWCVGPTCKRLSLHTLRPDWLPRAALPSRMRHKGVDRPDHNADPTARSERCSVQPRLHSFAGTTATPPPFPAPPTTTLTSLSPPCLTPFPTTRRLPKPRCRRRPSRSAPSTARLCRPMLHSLVRPPHLLPVRCSPSTHTAMSLKPCAAAMASCRI